MLDHPPNTNRALTVSSGEIWQRVVAPLLCHEVVDHVGVEIEGRRRQSLHHDVREVVREEHQVAPGVVQEVRVVLALVLPDLHGNYVYFSKPCPGNGHFPYLGERANNRTPCTHLSDKISLESQLILNAEGYHCLVILLGRVAHLLK